MMMMNFRFSGAILNFGVKESPDKVSIRTIEKLTPKNMGIAFGILALGGTEPEIHLGVIYPPPIKKILNCPHIGLLLAISQ